MHATRTIHGKLNIGFDLPHFQTVAPQPFGTAATVQQRI
jgi:hypothetical protein